MRPIAPIPVRHAAAFGITALCSWLALLTHYQAVAELACNNLWGAPPSPPASFLEALFVVPGALAGSPLALPVAIFELEWLTQTGLILGACFFWYCIGWHVDSARGVLRAEVPPVIVRWYLSALITVSVVLFPIGILSGVNLGVHSCANGVPSYWAELVGYGIVMFWTTIACYFGWLRFRTARREERSLISLR